MVSATFVRLAKGFVIHVVHQLKLEVSSLKYFFSDVLKIKIIKIIGSF